ncbi:MAG: aspartate-semialdehyde dehydrogenase [Erysipelotrichales bacterium]|nr:aspartate-semialdehyde dehydrogenase [Erysipelotrichales bacterium]
MKKNVALIGATGMVGQRFLLLLENHPWFDVKFLAASKNSSGKKYKDAVGNRWRMEKALPEKYQELLVLDATADCAKIARAVDFIFCAVDMPKDDTKALEELYAKYDVPVVSNNSANRMVSDVPMIIPEVNPEHLKIIPAQRKRLGTKKGFIAAKSNCSIQSYVPLVDPFLDYGIEEMTITTLQAISGAGKDFNSWPEMVDNVIPFIGGEEAKSETEPLKIWGKLEDSIIKNATNIPIHATCIRVPVTDGHMASVKIRFKKKIDIETIKDNWKKNINLNLPSAPKKFIQYFEEENFPQTKLHRDLEAGMTISCGRLKQIDAYTVSFVGLSHNTLRGAAGGAVLLAELLCAENYI